MESAMRENAHIDAAEDLLRLHERQAFDAELPCFVSAPAGAAPASQLVQLTNSVKPEGLFRVRRVITRSKHGIRCKFISRKMNCTVHAESLIERDACLLFEYDPRVQYYQEQPSEETYYDAKQRVHMYYPDFLVRLVTGDEYIFEVKPAAKLLSPKAREKYARIAMHFERQGRPFRLWSETHIRRQPLFNNLKRLHQACAPRGPQDEFGHVVEELRAQAAHYELSELIRRVGSENRVLRLIGAGALHTNLDQPLTPTSRVWTQLPMENHDDPNHL